MRSYSSKTAYWLVELNAIIGVTVNPVPLEDLAYILHGATCQQHMNTVIAAAAAALIMYYPKTERTLCGI